MSKYTKEDRSAPGYFLPESSQQRLHELQLQIAALSCETTPGRSEHADDTGGEFALLGDSLTSLAAQMQQVLDTLIRQAQPETMGSHSPDDADQPNDTHTAETTPYADLAATSTQAAPYDFGMTLDQLDELHRLLDLLRAQGDLLMASAGGEFADGTLIVMGSAIFDGADAAKDLVRQVERQVPVAPARPGLQVREMRPVYGSAAPARGDGDALH